METRDIEGYVATQTLTVDSSDVERTEQAAGRIVALQEKWVSRSKSAIRNISSARWKR